MKYLVSGDFKVMRKGLAVVADESVGEFIYDTEADNSNMSKGQYVELAKANKIKVSTKLSADDMAQSINEALMNNDAIPTQDEETVTVKVNKDLEKVVEIVRECQEAGNDDDQTMIAIVNGGIGFKKAAKLYQQALEQLGVKVSKKDRNQKIDEYLAAIEFAPESSDDVLAVVEALTTGDNKIEDTNAAHVIAAIKRYAKQHNLDLPEIKKPKAAKGGRGAGGGFRSEFVAWAIKHQDATDAEVEKYVLDAGKPEALAKRFVGWFDFARQFKAA